MNSVFFLQLKKKETIQALNVEKNNTAKCNDVSTFSLETCDVASSRHDFCNSDVIFHHRTSSEKG